jgi:hypothetical protein
MNLKSRPDYKRLEWDYKKVDKLAAQLRPGLEAWADRFHLRGPDPNFPVPRWTILPLFKWLKDPVVSTLLAWDRGERLDPLRWSFPSLYAGVVQAEDPDPFNLDFETLPHQGRRDIGLRFAKFSS